jgi:glyoxylase-like metal-dependent hydrolase (beta-lactamase superfamily II)
MDRFQIGDVTVSRVVEIETPTEPTWLYADMVPEAFDPHRSWLEPHFLSAKRGLIQMAIQTFVVESEGAKIVVDTCVGNDKERPQPFWNMLDLPFLERMRDAGHPPESVDRVLCTHLHVDHVGWNTRLVDGEWVPTFPSARYLFGRVEWRHWPRGRWTRGGVAVRSATRCGRSSTAGSHELVETDHRVTDEVWLEPTPATPPATSACASPRAARRR